MRHLYLSALCASAALASICSVSDGGPEGSAGGGKSKDKAPAPAPEVAAEALVAALVAVRVLWVPPGEKNLVLGKVYALADGAHLVSAGEAELVGDDVEAEADPRPQPEAPASDDVAE